MHVSSAHLILEGRYPSLLRVLSRAIRYPVEASTLLFAVTSQIRCQNNQNLPSISTVPVWYRAWCCHLRNLGTRAFCDPVAWSPTSPSLFLFHSLALHQR